MAQYSTEAILLAVRNWGEADKMVTFFSRDMGKIKAVAYGCRRPKSPLAGGMQIFSQLRLQVMSGNQLDSIRQCETLQSFKEVREDLVCVAYAAFLAEVTAECCPEHHPEPAIYDLLLAAFSTLDLRNPRLVALAAAYQLLEYTGYQPSYTKCVICQSEITTDSAFSIEKGGAVCPNCRSADMLAFTLPMQGFIKNLLQLNWHRMEPFAIRGAILMSTESLLLAYLQFILDKPLKSLNFIKQLATLPKV